MLYGHSLQPAERYSNTLPSQTSTEIDEIAAEIGPLTDKLLALEPRKKRNVLRGLAADRAISRPLSYR
jgi:hypothetical protein